MAEEYKIEIGAVLSASALSSLQSQINGLNINPIKIKIDDENIKSQINSLRKQIQSLGNIKINLGGSSVSNGGIKKNVSDITTAYNDLIKLQSRINSIRLKISGLDSTKNSGQITELSGQLNRLMADYNNLYQTFSKQFSTEQIDNLNRAFETTNGKITALDAKMQDTSNIKQRETAYKQLLTTAKQIDSLELKIGSLKAIGGNSSQISILESQLESLRNEYQSLATSLQGQLSTSQLSKLGQSFYEAQSKLEQLNAKITDTKAKMASNIKTDISNGSLENQVLQIESRFNSLNIKSDEVSTHIEKLKSLMSTMDSSDDIESVVADYEVFKNTLETVTNKVSILQREQKSANMATKLEQSRTALNSQIDVWLKDNSAAAKQFGAQLKEIQVQIKTADATQLQHLKAEFQEITRQAKLTGVATQSMGDKLKKQMNELSVYFSASFMMLQSIQTIKKMYDNVLKVDTAMTELYRVTDLTGDQYEALYKKMTNSAKKYGATLDDIISSTASWVRLGFNAEVSEQLAEVTAMYQHVTDLDYNTAVTNLITAYKGYQDELLKATNGDQVAAVERVSDIFDKLGNEMPVTAAQVGEGLTKCASVMEQAGATIEQATGMITGGGSITQDFDAFGTALKISTLRIKGMKGELEELGEDVDENINSASKMQTQILNLTHGKVNIFEDDGQTFRNIYDIYNDIAKVYGELSDTDAANLLETIAGKNRANQILAMITNWDDVTEAVQKASNAEGTATEENEKYMNSMQGKINDLITSWQELSNTFLSSDFLKGLIDGGNTLLSILDSITGTFGTLPTLITAVTAALSFKNIGRTKMFVLNNSSKMPIVVIVLFGYEQFRCYQC